MSPRVGLASLVEASTQRFVDRPLFGLGAPGGRWRWISHGEVGRLVAEVRAGLVARGVRPGDRVALVADNGLEWAVCAWAILGTGAVLVPLSSATPPDEVARAMRDQAAAALLAERSVAKAVAGREPNPPAAIIALDGSSVDVGSLRALMEVGRRAPVPPRTVAEEVPAVVFAGRAQAPSTLSHGELLDSLDAMRASLPIEAADRAYSVVSWSASRDWLALLHLLLSTGASLALPSAPDGDPEDLRGLQPTLLLSSPAFLERLAGHVAASPRGRRTAAPARLFEAWRAAQAAPDRHRGAAGLLPHRLLQRQLLGRLVGRRVAATLGGRLALACCDGAFPSLASLILRGVGVACYEVTPPGGVARDRASHADAHPGGRHMLPSASSGRVDPV